jgi:hypothetical protein
MSDYWFKPKTHGYGATPANWKGWAATTVALAIILGSGLLVFGLEPTPASRPNGWKIGGWLVFVAIVFAVFLQLCRAKTDGQWAWRWRKYGEG